MSSGLLILAGRTSLVALPDVRRFRHPKNAQILSVARYFLDHTQNMLLNGEGYVLWHGDGRGHVGRFEICQHKKESTRDARPDRGWFPGFCAHCGLDMTIDSSG